MSTILLAEDDPDIRHLIAWKLRRAGFDVVESEDGSDTLELARQRPPDLVLLDVRLPRLDGLSICRALRNGARTSRTPIIMVTARSRPQDVEQAYEAGATDYVVKPFSPRALLDRVEAVLSRAAS